MVGGDTVGGLCFLTFSAPYASFFTIVGFRIKVLGSGNIWGGFIK